VGSPVAGQAFFITNQEPVPFWTFTGDLLEGLGYRCACACVLRGGVSVEGGGAGACFGGG